MSDLQIGKSVSSIVRITVGNNYEMSEVWNRHPVRPRLLDMNSRLKSSGELEHTVLVAILVATSKLQKALIIRFRDLICVLAMSADLSEKSTAVVQNCERLACMV